MVLVSFDQKNSRKFVTISSYGPPVSPDEIQHLGKSNFRTKAAQEYVKPGTGLGLKLVRKIADLHHMAVEFKTAGPERIIEGKRYTKFIVDLYY